MANHLPKISESEWQVMKTLWDNAPMTANQVVDQLTKTTNWKPKTIKTLLNRLVTKKVLGFDKKGRSYNYYPLVSRTECTRAENLSFINRVYDGALNPMLSAFLKDKKLSSEEIDELKQILDNQGEIDK